jgi:hypothetical protein
MKEIYTVTDIEYDTEYTEDLPKTLEIKVNSILDNYEKIEFISDKISDLTGFCHKGFSVTPMIEE